MIFQTSIPTTSRNPTNVASGQINLCLSRQFSKFCKTTQEFPSLKIARAGQVILRQHDVIKVRHCYLATSCMKTGTAQSTRANAWCLELSRARVFLFVLFYSTTAMACFFLSATCGTLPGLLCCRWFSSLEKEITNLYLSGLIETFLLWKISICAVHRK